MFENKVRGMISGTKEDVTSRIYGDIHGCW